MRLNVGCGEHYAPDWCNIDLHSQGPKPDVECSVLWLPFQDETFTHIYCGHVLEHILPAQMPRALRELRRVLTPDGTLAVVGPDVRLTLEHEPLLYEGVLEGGGRWPGDEHRWTSTGDGTLEFLRHVGFDAARVELGDLDDCWPVVDRRALWQFAIVAKRGS